MSLRSPIEELEKELKELRGVAAPWEEQRPDPLELPGTGPPTKEYTWRALYVAEDGLVGHQWEERLLGLRVFYAPV